MSLQTACLQCPANSVTNGTAATSPRHCTCIVGYYNMQLANETVECFQCFGSNLKRTRPAHSHWTVSEASAAYRRADGDETKKHGRRASLTRFMRAGRMAARARNYQLLLENFAKV